MYATCLRCDRSLGRNAELPHLPVGRRVAFDGDTGRVWVICRSCGQWNLVPVEERWEALADCERVALEAEARVAGGPVGLARTAAGLELLRVGAMPAEDIANWRYGRRLQRRQGWLRATNVLLAAVAAMVGAAAGIAVQAAWLGVWVAVVLAIVLLSIWRHPPRPWLRVADAHGKRYLLLPWHIQRVHVATDADTRRPVLVLPHLRGHATLHGRDALAVLGRMLPALNGSIPGDVNLRRVVGDVHEAETIARRPPRKPGRGARQRGRKRPGYVFPEAVRLSAWERLARYTEGLHLAYTTPERRLALEMAVTEELERLAMREDAEALGDEWRDEEEVGRIADDLLLPEAVSERLRALRGERENGG